MRTCLWSVLAVAVALAACDRRASLEVTVATPQGPQATSPGYARFQLSRPLYDPEKALAAEVPSPRITIEPAVAFRAQLSGPSTIDVDFDRPLPDATTFTLTLHAGLTSADGKAVLGRDETIRFTTPTNRLTWVETDSGLATSAQGTLEGLGPRDALQLDFARPIPREQARLVRVFVEDGAALPVQFELPESGPVGRLTLRPEHGWPRDTRLRLSVDKGLLVAAEGAGRLAGEAQNIRLRTWGALDALRGPAADESVCVEPHRLTVPLNNPVRCSDVLEYVSVPGSKPVCVGTSEDRRLRLELMPALKGSTTAELTLRRGMPDVHGERLEADRTFSFRTCAPDVAVAGQTPFVILDPGQAADHVERVVGAAALQVDGRRLPFEQVWRVLRGQELTDQVAWTDLPWWMEYDYDWYEGERRPPGDLRNPLVAELEGASTVIVPAPPGKGKVRDYRVGLEQFLEDQRGLVLMRVTPLGSDHKPVGQPVLRLVNVTDIGLSVRASEENLAVLAARYSDGKALGGAKLTVYDEEGRHLAEGTTAEDGLARMTLPRHEGSGERKLIVVATHGRDEAFVWSRFAVDSSWYWTHRDLLGLIYTDRGIYRPGETVRFRGIARKATGQGFASLAGTTARLRVTAPDGSSLLTEAVTFSQWGTFTRELPIDAGAALGAYRIAVETGEQSISTYFSVGEFRRAEMRVDIQTPPSVARGDTLAAIVQADYLFGAPASGLELRWSLTRSPAWFNSKRFERASFTDADDPPWRWYGSDRTEIIADGRTKLDDKGSFSIRQALRLADPVRQFERLTISATVEDRNGQTISRQRTLSLYNTEAIVGLERGRYLLTAGEPTQVSAVAVTPEDEPAAGVEVVIRSSQTWWRSVQRAGPGGGIYTHSERVQEEGVERCRGRTDESGRFTCTVTPERGGDLRLYAEAKDRKGGVSKTSTWHWVIGKDDYWGRSDDSREATILFETDEVDAGKIAKAVITSPFPSGVALVTVEREDVRWQKAFEMGTTLTVDLPTDRSWAPNVEVVATIVRGRLDSTGEGDARRDRPAYALGRRTLKVRPTDAILEVSVEAQKPRLEPGQTQIATAVVKGRDGRPVENAEVNLWAVDEGVLMLTNYRTPNPIEAMFAHRGRRTVGLDTRQYILARRQFAQVNKGEEEGGGGGEEADDSVRQNFDPLAVWVGSAITDANGRIETRFEVPDDLTTYRLMAVASSRDHRFGSGEAAFKVNKTLMLRQALPRFARPGDRMQAGVLVNHMGDRPATVTVKLESLDEKLFSATSPREVSFELPPGETRPVLFQLAAADVEGSGKIRFAARMGPHSDKVELEVPVIRIQPRESVSASGVLAAGSFSETFTVPDQARAVALAVNTSSLPLASLEDRLRSLVRYPYGCLEQRTSRALPLMAVRSLSDDLGLASIDSATVGQWVGEYLQLVPRYRCADGGFDYYPGCSWGSTPRLTSYALEGLLAARRFGYDVQQNEIDRTVTYLERQLGSMQGPLRDRTATLVALAEAGRAKPDIERVVFDGRTGLSLSDRADLVRAMAFRLGPAAREDAGVRTLMEEIDTRGRRDDGALFFDEEETFSWSWSSPQRTTALVLRALVQVDPADGRIPMLVRSLANLDGANRYFVTQQTAQTVLGLAEAVRVLKAGGAANTLATISVAGRTLAEQHDVAPKVETWTVPGDQLPASIPVKIENVGERPLFFGAFLSYAYPATARLPAKAAGFSVRREYLAQDGKPLALERTEGGEPILRLAVGDLVRVRVTIDPDSKGELVVADDPLPAGLEAVDTSLATADRESARRFGQSTRPWYASYHRELRDDRVEWHFQSVRAERIEVDYVARATTAGTWRAPGTYVERMYQPEQHGRAAGLTVVVRPRAR